MALFFIKSESYFIAVEIIFTDLCDGDVHNHSHFLKSETTDIPVMSRIINAKYVEVQTILYLYGVGPHEDNTFAKFETSNSEVT